MIRRYLFFFFPVFFLFMPLFSSYSAHAENYDEEACFFEDKYMVEYPRDFFRTGGKKVHYNSALHLKIGVVVKNQSGMLINEIIDEIFSRSPFDRYRDFFIFLRESDIRRAKRRRNYFVSAYDSYGRSIPGGFNIAEGAVRAGLVVLDANSYEFSKTGTLGYSRNKLATAQKITILHEFGHALAGLGDEYSINDDKNSGGKREALASIGISYDYIRSKVWEREYPNIDYRSHKILKWEPLIIQGFLPRERIKRVEIMGGADSGRFLIPSHKCIMNRIGGNDIGFCPVCQLQIIDAICSMTGVVPPWYDGSLKDYKPHSSLTWKALDDDSAGKP